MSAVWPTAVELVDLEVDPARGHVYVTDTAGRLRVFDSATDEQIAVLPGAGRIAVDSPHGRLYTGGEGADRVRVFDADALRQTGEIDTPARPVADAHSGGLYLVRSRGPYRQPGDDDHHRRHLRHAAPVARLLAQPGGRRRGGQSGQRPAVRHHQQRRPRLEQRQLCSTSTSRRPMRRC